MNAFGSLVAGLTNPIEALADFDAQVLLDAGFKPALVSEWTKVHKVYYGRVSDCLCAGAWFTSSPRIGLGMPQLVG